MTKLASLLPHVSTTSLTWAQAIHLALQALCISFTLLCDPWHTIRNINVLGTRILNGQKNNDTTHGDCPRSNHICLIHSNPKLWARHCQYYKSRHPREYNILDTHTQHTLSWSYKEAQVKVSCPLSVVSKCGNTKTQRESPLTTYFPQLQSQCIPKTYHEWSNTKTPNGANKLVESDETFETNNMHMHIIKLLWS